MLGNKYLINASNLHCGGGIQVATSVIGEISRFCEIPESLVIWVSSEVDRNLRDLGYDLSRLPSYEVIDSYGLGFILSPQAKLLRSFDRVLTIFGPLYTLRKGFYSIVGFAQAWIIYPNNCLTKKMSVLGRLKTKIKYFFQSLFFSRSDFLIAELEHVAKGLVNKKISTVDNVSVVRNCISSIYFKPQDWAPVSIFERGGAFKIGFLGRNYLHKNTIIIPLIKRILSEKHNLDVSFYVTFNSAEWDSCSEEFKSSVINVGSLSIAQCPSFYTAMDAIIFPSLLECFSATPIESMIMQKPLFVSDMPFNRDVCSSFAHYFDPLDANSAADSIAGYISYLKNMSFVDLNLSRARDHALNFSNAKERAEKYMGYLLSNGK